MRPLPSIVRKLIPCLASTHIGEAIAARDAITLALRSAGQDWHDLAEVCFPPGPAPAFRTSATSFGDMARACRDLDRGQLSAAERDFILRMCSLGFRGRPSPRQADWLVSIFDRLARRAAA